MNDVNGAYVAGTDVNPDQPSIARKPKTATRAARIVKAARRTMAANVRSPRRLVGPGAPAWPGPVRSGEAVAVTGAPCRGGATSGYDDRDAVVPARVWSAPGGDLRDDRRRLLRQRRGEGRRAGSVRSGLLALAGHHIGEVALDHVGGGRVTVGGAGQQGRRQHPTVRAPGRGGAGDGRGPARAREAGRRRGLRQDLAGALGARRVVVAADLDRHDA